MKFTIDTDLTSQGTAILKDGVNIGEDRMIASISFTAEGKNKKYNEDSYIYLNITSFDSDGNVYRETFGKNKNIQDNITPIGVEDSAKLDMADFEQFIGVKVEDSEESNTDEKSELIDNIIKISAEKKIKCASKEILSKRSIDSLKDKLADLGFTSDEA